MATLAKKRYIFIDTNLLRKLFVSSKFADDTLPILKSLSEAGYTLLMPQQVVDEIERNRFDDWVGKINENKITKLKKDLSYLENIDANQHKSVAKLRLSLEKEIKKLEKEREQQITQLTSSRGKASITLNKLIKISKIIDDSEEIASATHMRFLKGNPPYDREPNGKNGDRYIWESLLYFFRRSKLKKVELYFFTTNTNDWCVQVDSEGKSFKIHPFLEKEFKKSIKGAILWSNEFKDLPDISAQDRRAFQEKEDVLSHDLTTKQVEDKIVALLKYSNTWDETDNIIRKVKPHVENFSKITIIEILKAAHENAIVSFGPYNQVTDASQAFGFFARLFKRSLKLGMSLDVWKEFYLKLDEAQQERYVSLRHALEREGVEFTLDELKYILPSDIPF